MQCYNGTIFHVVNVYEVAVRRAVAWTSDTNFQLFIKFTEIYFITTFACHKDVYTLQYLMCLHHAETQNWPNA